MYMSYDEYVETFESLKGQDKAKEGKAASGTEEEGGWRPSMGWGMIGSVWARRSTAC